VKARIAQNELKKNDDRAAFETSRQTLIRLLHESVDDFDRVSKPGRLAQTTLVLFPQTVSVSRRRRCRRFNSRVFCSRATRFLGTCGCFVSSAPTLMPPPDLMDNYLELLPELFASRNLF
jgi:hypothetical protein